MNPVIKRVVRRVVPKSVLVKAIPLWNAYVNLKISRIKQSFQTASTAPEWLGQDELEALWNRYPPVPAYAANPDGRQARAQERLRDLRNAIVDWEKTQTVLEIGCSDGMLAAQVQQAGKTVHAIDLSLLVSESVRLKSGVQFQTMDAEHLAFDDAVFDLVYSYNCFEHFRQPELVFREALRVLKPGGFLYASFGPLYYSPYGLHGYDAITLPYCQLLFPRETLEAFVASKGGSANLPYDELNKWGVEDFRALWDRYAATAKRIKYTEVKESFGLDLVSRYPSCFKAKTDSFDNLVVFAIEALFQKM